MAALAARCSHRDLFKEDNKGLVAGLSRHRCLLLSTNCYPAHLTQPSSYILIYPVQRCPYKRKWYINVDIPLPTVPSFAEPLLKEPPRWVGYELSQGGWEGPEAQNRNWSECSWWFPLLPWKAMPSDSINLSSYYSPPLIVTCTPPLPPVCTSAKVNRLLHPSHTIHLHFTLVHCKHRVELSFTGWRCCNVVRRGLSGTSGF